MNGPSLEISGLTVRFGGLVAVNGVSLSARVGQITGLIGPNGAGKSTTFDACSGLIEPTSGRVTFGDVDLTNRPAVARAAAGIGRTFQRMELFDSLSVFENVAMGREAHLAGRSPVRQLFARGAERADVQTAAEDALRFCGIEHLTDQSAGLLSTGQRRLVELARCLAGDFAMLLLDEPSSGLDSSESEHFGGLLQRVVADRGVGILIVEHDMSLIADVCDYVYVLDFGQLIFEGTATDVLASAVVRAAYLGDEPLPMEDAS